MTDDAHTISWLAKKQAELAASAKASPPPMPPNYQKWHDAVQKINEGQHEPPTADASYAASMDHDYPLADDDQPTHTTNWWDDIPNWWHSTFGAEIPTQDDVLNAGVRDFHKPEHWQMAGSILADSGEMDSTKKLLYQMFDGYESTVDAILAARASAPTITAQQLAQVLSGSVVKKLQLQNLDSQYDVVGVTTWGMIMHLMWESKFQYIAEFRDCDNYGEALSGDSGLLFAINSCGWVWDFSGSHSYNAIVTYDDTQMKSPPSNADIMSVAQVKLIEPQSMRFVQPGPISVNTPGQGYILQSGRIIFA